MQGRRVAEEQGRAGEHQDDGVIQFPVYIAFVHMRTFARKPQGS